MFQKGDIVKVEKASTKEASIHPETNLMVVDIIENDVLGVPIVPSSGPRDDPLPEDALVHRISSSPLTIRFNQFRYVPLNACAYLSSLKPKYHDRILRKIIFYFTERHHESFHARQAFVPGETYIRYAGRVYDEKEMVNLMDAGLDFWLTEGRFVQQWEQAFSKFLGVQHSLLVNSGSSANLLALTALTSPKLGKKQLKAGDEVITAACAFPTTVAPILQNNLVPVFMDVALGTYNIDAKQIEDALSEKTKAIFLAHTLGNPFDLESVMRLAKKHDLWVIEDACDALGSIYQGRYAGTFGHIATFSFYAAHQMTMGEGGAVVTSDPLLKRLIGSFRDWGRDCWCKTGCDNTCGKRFGWQLGTLPAGYDHKYIYSHLGYNLKITDLQAAIGVAQLQKLPAFIETRKKNWRILFESLKRHEKHLILPSITENSEPCWFGFPLTVKEGAPFTRGEMVAFLERNKIATRSLFAGNIIRHPAFEQVSYRCHGKLEHTDRIMNDTFWIGVYPGITPAMLDFIVSRFDIFFETYP